MRYFVFILLLLTLASCSIRNYEKPEATREEKSSLKMDRSDRFRAAEPIADWWTHFNDSYLDSLIRNALKHNNEVDAAVANIQRTRALLREAGFDLYPVADIQGGYTFQIQSAKNGLPIIDRGVEIYDVSVDANWQIDLFGRVSQAKKAAEATYQASIAELNGIYLSVAAQVASAYIQLRGSQRRLEVARQNVETQKETHNLTKKLVAAGTGSELDSARSRSQLELTRAEIPSLKAQVQSAINRLSVLTGRPPNSLNEWLEDPEPLPSIPPAVALGNAEDMLRRRPDINRAERQLAASVAEFNVAATDFFPQVEIFGTVGFSAANFTDIGSAGSLIGGFGPSISWSILDFGRVKARVDAADASTRAQMANYRQTVLEALEEVSTAMSDFSEEEKRRQNLIEAGRASARAAELARQRYQAGLTSFLDVLDAERTLLQAQDQLALSNMAVATDLISIYTALGGGWEVMADTTVTAEASRYQTEQ